MENEIRNKNKKVKEKEIDYCRINYSVCHTVNSFNCCKGTLIGYGKSDSVPFLAFLHSFGFALGDPNKLFIHHYNFIWKFEELIKNIKGKINLIAKITTTKCNDIDPFIKLYYETFKKAKDPQFLNKVFLVRAEVIGMMCFKIAMLNGGIYLLIKGEIMNFNDAKDVFNQSSLDFIRFPSNNDIRISKAVIKNLSTQEKLVYHNPDPLILFLMLSLWLRKTPKMNDIKSIDPNLHKVLFSI